MIEEFFTAGNVATIGFPILAYFGLFFLLLKKLEDNTKAINALTLVVQTLTDKRCRHG